ncbi:MAG: DUF1573 domain-containing protein [Bacteroidetes bacterium]|nr:DUF1573 domain-containing protein [Bacteroidota bacterium]
MKTIVIALALVASGFAVLAQSGPQLVWEKSVHDFGQITEGSQVQHTFKFTNKGKEPLILTSVQPTCGCTVPNNWPKDPIPPGASGEITVSFNSTGRTGSNTKVIKVFSNAANEGADHFTFTAKVVQKDAN